MGLLTICLVLSQNLTQYLILTFIMAVGSGGWDSGNSPWIIEMWGERAPTLLHLQQLMVGIGTILSPLLASPFVLGEIPYNKTEESVTSLNVSTTAVVSYGLVNQTIDGLNPNYSVDRRSKLIVPYSIAGFMMCTSKFIDFL